MKKIKYMFVFLLLLPLLAFPQSALIRNIYPIIETNHIKDTIKSVSAPYVYFKSKNSYAQLINSSIKVALFNPKKYDTTQSLEKLLGMIYKSDKNLKMSYEINLDKNGFLSLTIHIVASKGNDPEWNPLGKPPIYLNFDLTSGKLLCTQDFVKSKNDSVSLVMSIIPIITDSVRLFEVRIDKDNPKHSDIIQYLNNILGDFRHHYPEDFILTDRDIIFCFNCILPSRLMAYYHIYSQTFNYKVMRNIFKPEIARRLLTP